MYNCIFLKYYIYKEYLNVRAPKLSVLLGYSKILKYSALFQKSEMLRAISNKYVSTAEYIFRYISI